MKSDPDHPRHDAAREGFQQAKQAASFTAARRALADAIRKADDALQEQVARIGQEHGVMVQ